MPKHPLTLSSSPRLPVSDTVKRARLPSRTTADPHHGALQLERYNAAALLPPQELAGEVKALLELGRPRTVAGLWAHLSAVRKVIDRLTPTKWPKADSLLNRLMNRHLRSLVHMWNEWLATVETLYELGAFPRPNGTEAQHLHPRKFDSLFLAILKRPLDWQMARAHQANRLARAKAKAQMASASGHNVGHHDGSTPALFPLRRRNLTIPAVLHLMDKIGLHPTEQQIKFLLQHMSIGVLHKCAHAEKDNAMNRAARRAIDRLVRDAPVTSYGTKGGNAAAYAVDDKHAAAYSSELWLTGAQVVLDHFEKAKFHNSPAAASWSAELVRFRPLLLNTARPHVLRASTARGSTPSKHESLALWLILRDVLVSAPIGRELRATWNPVGAFDLGNPLDLIHLLMGSNPDAPLTLVTGKRLNSGIMRVAREAGHRGQIGPVVELCDLLAVAADSKRASAQSAVLSSSSADVRPDANHGSVCETTTDATTAAPASPVPQTRTCTDLPPDDIWDQPAQPNPPPPLAVFCAAHLADAARVPEDLMTLLPRLLRLNVDPAVAREAMMAVVQPITKHVLSVAHQAEAQGVGGANVARDVHDMFVRWGAIETEARAV